MKLVDNWKQSWRWSSMQVAGLGATICGAWEVLPNEFKKAFTADEIRWLACGSFLLINIVRIIDFSRKKKNKNAA